MDRAHRRVLGFLETSMERVELTQKCGCRRDESPGCNQGESSAQTQNMDMNQGLNRSTDNQGQSRKRGKDKWSSGSIPKMRCAHVARWSVGGAFVHSTLFFNRKKRVLILPYGVTVPLANVPLNFITMSLNGGRFWSFCTITSSAETGSPDPDGHAG